MKKESVNLEDYKGSNIEKGLFCKEVPLTVEQTLQNNLEKGLIDQDLFNKAMEELDILKGKKVAPFESKKDDKKEDVEKAKEEKDEEKVEKAKDDEEELKEKEEDKEKK